MRKLLLGLGICLILGIALYFTAQYWVRGQTLRSIESATGAKIQMQAFSIELLDGRVSLHEVVLVPKKPSTLVEQIIVADATGRFRWNEWSSGMISMEAALDRCTVILRQGNRERFFKDHIQCPKQSTPILSQDSDSSVETREARIVLTALTAKNVTILDGSNRPALANSVGCTARRSMSGWQGKLTAESLGTESLLLTHVQIGFSADGKGTRVAEFRCNFKEGTVSGNGCCTGDGLTALDLQVDSLPLASVAPAWCGSAISGMISGSFNYKGDLIHWQNGTVIGNFALKDGTLILREASQMLSLINELSNGGALQLDSAAATLTLAPEEWTLSQISMKKEGIFEMNGNLSCGQGAKLKADLKLGIATPGQSENIQRIPLRFETTPDQLWQGILASLLTSVSKPAPAESPKPALQEKTKAAVDAVLNIFGR